MRYTKSKFIFLLTLWLFIPCSAFAVIDVDGHLNETEWLDAQSFPNFVVIDPRTLDTPRLKTETKVLSTPEGLAVAFICEQPSNEIRTRTVTARDAASTDADSVTLIVDFDGTGEIGYLFRVSITGSYSDGTILSQDQIKYDWDGIWKRAVNEDQQNWTVEILLPWSIAPIRDDGGETMSIRVSFKRELYSTKETFAFPEEIWDTSHTVLNSAKIEVARYSSKEFDLLPYVTILSDLSGDTTEAKAGLDLFWKPSGRFQVSAAVNPDFGQVESDELIIDFSAFETYFSDKRPFFTENQTIFDTGTMGKLVYTRRVGAARDDGNGVSEIDSAVKIIGSSGPIKYGVLFAHESDEVGRSFYVGRVILPTENWNIGVLTDYVNRPFLDRIALVNAIDYSLELFGRSLHWHGQFIRSDIDTPIENSSGFGLWSGIHYNLSKDVRFVLYLQRYDDKVDTNDMGYLKRNNYEELMLRVMWQNTNFEKDSPTASVSWALSPNFSRNTDGDRFPASLQLSRNQNMRNGTSISLNMKYTTGGYDDMFSRGNGIMYINERWGGSAAYTTQRRGAWSKSIGMEVFQEGCDDWGLGLNGNTTWYPNDNLNIAFYLNTRWSRDWLNWLGGDRIGDFSRRQVTGKISGNWFPADKHEIRLLSQWVTVNAEAIKGYRIGNNGRLVPDADPINDFAAINFGLQIRYRYEIAPLSYLYLVYSRGGLDYINDPDQSTLGLLGESTNLRDSDQVCLKIQYRF